MPHEPTGSQIERLTVRHQLIHALLVILLVTTPAVEASAAGANGKGVEARPVVEVVGGSRADLLTLKWAVDRYATLPGRLPGLTVHLHPDDDCLGKNALYSQARKRIRFCNDGSGTTAPHQTMLHELGHAWSFEYLSRDLMAAFMALQGLESWAPDDVAWWQSGQEQAAEILAWGLMGDRPTPSFWTRFESCVDLVAGFTLLTDRMPDRPLEHCKRDSAVLLDGTVIE